MIEHRILGPNAIVPKQAGLPSGWNFACIYLAEDAAGDIIYVGKTNCWRQRREQHSRQSPWWSAVVRIHCLVYDYDDYRTGEMWDYGRDGCNAQLKIDEMWLIRALHPVNNKQGLEHLV